MPKIEKTKILAFRVVESLHKRIRHSAVDDGISLQAAAAKLIELGLALKGKGK